MPAKAAAGIVAQQQHDEHPQGMFLKIGTGSDRASPFIQPALAANTYAVSVIAAARSSECFKGRSIFISPFLQI